VPARVSPNDRVRAKIDELFASDRELPEILEEVARLGAQLLMQAALEAEVTEFLGRDRYQRTAVAPDGQPGARNGYRPVSVKTTAGPVTLERPKLRGTTTAFASRLFGKHVTKTNALESLVIASFVRGLSVRDVEATLADALGDQAAISKSTVSQICQAIKTEYDTWAERRLDDIVLDYLFLDASFFRMHPGSPAEPVLAAWGVSTDGKPVFVGLASGSGESTDAWADFLTDLADRGLGCPLLVVSDGARGLIAAIEQVFPAALRQRCLIHRLRNVLAKIPAGMQSEIRDGYWAAFDTAEANIEPGPRLVELVDARLGAFAARYAATYPAAMKILGTDSAGLTAYLRFPAEHHHRIRHSNFIERTFGETRRRAKVIGRFPGETSCISIAWAVLDRASRGWRGLSMTPAGLRGLQDLRRSLLQPPQQLRPQHTPEAADSTTETVSATA
jgi:putative transposase